MPPFTLVLFYGWGMGRVLYHEGRMGSLGFGRNDAYDGNDWVLYIYVNVLDI